MRERGPVMYVLAMVLAIFGIKTLSTGSSPESSAARGEKIDARSKEPEPGSAGSKARPLTGEFWHPLRDFWYAQLPDKKGDGETKEPWPGFPDIPGYSLEFLIAEVPDPLDSSSGYLFDPLVDAIQRAVETEGFVLDGYWYPWRRPGEAAGKGESSAKIALEILPNSEKRGREAPALQLTAAPQNADEARPSDNQPGVFLFRHGDRADLLMLFLVGETATSGMHKQQFLASLNFIQRSQSYHRRRPIRILGPSFTGASTSLQITIKQWAERETKEALPVICASMMGLIGFPQVQSHLLAVSALYPGRTKDGPLPTFQVVSGSATGMNKDNFQQSCLPVHVCFRATVIPEKLVLKELFHYLTLDQPETMRSVALLSESNTAFGRSIREGLKKELNPKQSGEQDQIEPLALPFPLHISEVRSAYDRANPKAGRFALPTVGGKLHIPFQDKSEPRDTEPTLAQDTSAATDELILDHILSTISREGIRYVVLSASDVKDKIFLATVIRDYCPDVQLILSNNDLLFAHADHSYYFRGAIVGSTYPLYSRNQCWSFPFEGNKKRLLLLNQGVQGYYNAAIAQLYEGRNNLKAEPKSNQPDWPKLLEYGSPFEQPRTALASPRPPIWISIIGQDGPHPLAVVLPGKAAADKNNDQESQNDNNLYTQYVWAFSTTNTTPATGTFSPRQSSWAAPFIAAMLFGLAFCLLTASNWIRSQPQSGSGKFVEVLGPLEEKSPAESYRRKHVYYLFSCFFFLCVLYCFAAVICLIPLVIEGYKPVDLGFSGKLVAWIAITTMVALLLSLRWSFHFWVKEPWPPRLADRWQRLPRLIATKGWRKALGWLIEGWRDRVYYDIAALLIVLSSAYLVYTYAWPRPLESAASALLFFERATKLTSGVSPVVPVFLLGMAFFCWGYARMKRMYLLTCCSVKSPLPDKGQMIPEGLSSLHAETIQLLAQPHRTVVSRWPIAILALVVPLFAFCRFYDGFIPTQEGSLFDSACLFAFALFSWLLAYAMLEMQQLWGKISKLLQQLARLPMAGAYSRLPMKASSMFGPYLSSLRPGRQATLTLRKQQFRALAAEYQGINHSPSCADALSGENMERLDQAMSVDEAATEKLEIERLREAAKTCVVCLEPFWRKRPLSEAFPDPASSATGESEKKPQEAGPALAPQPVLPGEREERAVRKWVELAEDFVALEIVNYVSQFFVQLRNLVMFLTIGPLLLMLAVTSYPFQPQRLLLVFIWVLIGILVVAAVAIFTQIERDELVSRISRTTPHRLSLHWGFFSNVLSYTLPLLAGLAAVSTSMSELLHAWLDPIFQVLK